MNLKRQETEYMKPIYVGCSILDLSQLKVLDFQYNVIHKNFERQYNLIYSDTDNLVYNIKHDDIYEWINDNREHFDLSEFVRLDMLDTTNKKVLGKFKYEIHGLVMT